jgi:transcriptional regulator
MSYYNGKVDPEKRRKARLILKWAKKIKAIKTKGSKCEMCQEERPWLLEFHHINKDDKESEFNKLYHQSWDEIEKELQRCILVCRNCHGDIHFKDSYLEFKDEIISKSKNVSDRGWLPVDQEKILLLNKKGLTQKQIGEEVGCADSTVCGVLKSNGVHTEKTKKIVNPLDILALRKKGLTNPQIADILGIHRFTIPHVLKRHKGEIND